MLPGPPANLQRDISTLKMSFQMIAHFSRERVTDDHFHHYNTGRFRQ